MTNRNCTCASGQLSGHNGDFQPIIGRPQSCGLESVTAGLQSLRLASRLKPWLKTIDGWGWLIAASTAYRYYKLQN